MPSLKDLKNRIKSIKSTQKITKAQKMVAASKLRRAQLQAEASQPYSMRMFDMLSRLVSKINIDDSSPFLLAGTGNQQVHLVIVNGQYLYCVGHLPSLPWRHPAFRRCRHGR